MENSTWLAMGFAAITIAISLSFIYESLWLGFFTALAVGIILMILMTRHMFGEIESAGMKKTIILLFLGLAIIHVYNSVYSWFKAENQKTMLTEIRQTIDGSIAQIEVEKLMVESLRYKFRSEDEWTLEEAFIATAGDRLEEDGNIVFEEAESGKNLHLTAEIPQPDSILIHVVADIAKGNNLKYENKNGNTGKYQAVAILTPNGVRYVRQN